MKFEEMVLKRESCRKYQDKPVSREDLVKICEAGRLSPSACNSQPWKFLVVDDKEALDKFRDGLVLDDGKSSVQFRDQVPAYIAIIEETARVMPLVKRLYGTTQRYAQGDIGMAAMNMCYQAMDLGLSTCIIGLNNQKKLESYFGIPEGQEVRIILAVGYAAEQGEPKEKKRKEIEEVICFNEYK